MGNFPCKRPNCPKGKVEGGWVLFLFIFRPRFILPFVISDFSVEFNPGSQNPFCFLFGLLLLFMFCWTSGASVDLSLELGTLGCGRGRFVLCVYA